MELETVVQHYDWGKIGSNSVVARLKASADPKSTVDEQKPYAELWVGTHPNGPSLIIERNVLLSEYIKDNIDAIGPIVRRRFGVSVPFLLKILSIDKALSIQAHPNKTYAEELHRNFPEIYKDDNHKPELAIALTRFEALCGFRPLTEIKEFLKKLPELSSILSQDAVQTFLATVDQSDDSKLALKGVYSSLMVCDKEAIARGLKKLLTRLENEDEKVKTELLYNLLQRIHTQFPGDVGCFSLYFLNYLDLRPGEAIFLGPNLPHAYLSGECVECMASSDNVVRAGLTSKRVDVSALIGMLDYGSQEPRQLLFGAQLEDGSSCVWRPPVPDFAVAKIKVPGGESYNTIVRASPSVLIVTAGKGTLCDTEPISARPGVAVFLKASRQLTITAEDGCFLEAYQAMCNVS